ncbi:response regulator/GGDEF domain protein [Wolbachia endosymbiont of Armadillidium vulgare str. wVulC]|uniref:diguanylate cyclase n=1 Tax=Wolbachia endosymbiont of Armadillidium arcangelii TaxID=3158571 RepID=A0AAU7Q584_9RICK|nr:PleD family two-component system response regulator [Wolbachia endosymbiont of Armadillidium vulgare]KLT22180.1 response regulator/GGDEF domain protein [Wolbachia endosymbiont of Armadillidium vulgare str. wVulC]OJH31543.1 Response regulator PleD [Wolbachia endosymbiont of Armadillidium vulgare]OJH32235.1 Response regulator PleD [Wolbachia endosymbiont of Armadillidium vulgare]OJH32968.1 Response regulator PleD [Wolbachia endosymbiont of Armadillidium vulgare]
MTAKILVVDDIPSNVKLLEAQLKAEYYTVIVAHDGEEAIDLVAKQQPDIILLDVMMPKISGFEVCRELKNDPLTTHIPIIMVTALHDIHDRVQGINAGADDFLTKPIDETALSARIKSLMRLKTVIDELRLRGETNAEIGGVTGMDYSNQIFDASILVVDEDVFQAEQIYNVLKQRFSSIRILSDPMEALKVGIKDNYDLVISGMQFSKTDGLRLCSWFRSKVETRYTPILILSEDYDKSNLVKALDVGANDYLTVPLDESELIARVNSQVKRKRYQDALRMNLFNNVEMSIKDPLTNCYNRRYFDAHLRNIVKDSMEKDRSLSLMMLDIDYFKMVNDNFGHNAGDEFLKQVQKRISENIRVTDLLARFGGEEFVVVMPDTSISDACTIAERVRKIIAKKPFILADKNTAHNLTVSIGTAEMQKSDLDNIKEFIVRADKYLYKAKNSGRNRVVAG